MDIFSQFVQDLFEVSSDIDALLFEGAQDRHQNAPRMGASVRLGAKANLAGNHRGSEVLSAKLFSAGTFRSLAQW